MVEVENLVKKYGGYLAVDHLSFRVEKGQIYGFLGPNGAGKSTTMNIMTGYLAATEGSVKINGFDIMAQPEEAKRCIGYLPEVPPLYMEMKVGEYLKFAAELKGLPKGERSARIEHAMDLTRITDVSGRLIRNLSKGYKQRVGLAQAILGEPEVIILDEPTVGLDPKQMIEIRDLIRRLGEEHTVILSSHILSEVSAVCDHIMIISEGRLAASDSPQGLQKLKRGTADLMLTVIGNETQIKELFKGMEGNVEIICQSKNADELNLTVRTSSDTDIRRAVGTVLADGKIPVLSMNRKTETLEDIFLELTASEEAKQEMEEEEQEMEEIKEEKNNEGDF